MRWDCAPPDTADGARSTTADDARSTTADDARSTTADGARSITLDRAAKTASVEIEIDAASVSTGLAELEKHLRAEDFFNAEKFPKVTFKSTKVEFEGENPKAVHGDLTMLGVKKPVTMSVASFNCRVHPMNKKYVCGADAFVTIKRSEFGMTYAIPAVSDDVKLLIQVEAVRD